MTLKTALLATVGPMTPVERSMGRYMRAPDHDASSPGEGGGDDDDYNFDFDADTVENDVDNGDDDRLDEDSTDDQDGDDEDEGSGSEEDEDEERDQRIPDRAQRRIDRLTRRAKEAEEELRRLRGSNDGTKPKPAETSKKPVLDDFDTYEDWIEAITDWKADQREATRKASEAAEATERTFQQRLAKGRKAYADWDDVVTDDVRVTKTMQKAIMDSEDPAGLLYYLGRNPDEADDIKDLSDTQQIKRIGRIEDKLAARAKGTRKQSNAPKPIVPVKGGSKNLKTSVEEIEDVDEFIRRRNKDENVSRRY